MTIILKLPAKPRHPNGRSESEVAIEAVSEAFPLLSPNGMLHPDVRGFDPAQVETAMVFLGQCGKAKQATRGSYGLKHVAERWGRCNGLEPYISNGALIVAAIWMGFVVEWDGTHINVDVAVNKKDVQRLDRDLDCRKVANY